MATMEGKEMNRKELISWIILIIYNISLGMASYGEYLILTTMKSSINTLFLLSVVAYQIVYALLVIGVLGTNYFVWKKGWQWMFKK